ncbi:unnamed protein product [Musa acuminata var. zebrina]
MHIQLGSTHLAQLLPPTGQENGTFLPAWLRSASTLASAARILFCSNYLSFTVLQESKQSDRELRDTLFSGWPPLNSMGKQAMACLEEMNKHVMSHMTRGPALSSLSLQLPPPI